MPRLDNGRSTTHPRQRENCAIIRKRRLVATHSHLGVFSGQDHGNSLLSLRM